MFSDLRFACRSLLKSPEFTVVALVTLALCIGMNVIIFATVDAIVVRPLPYPEPERLVAVINSYPGSGNERAGNSVADYYDRRAAIKAFESVALYQARTAILGSAGSPTAVASARISADFFATLDVPLAMGRSFNESEMFPASSRVAILTDAFWVKQFAADPHVLGRTFQVDAQPVTVIGVLPPGFRYLSSQAQFFTPTASQPPLRTMRHRGNDYPLIARLAKDATLDVAQSQLDALNAQLTQESPYAALLKAAHFHAKVYPLHADHVCEVRPILLILQAGGLLLLLIGGANFINLLLIRASTQVKGLAIRQALGARRWHLAREILSETTLLAASGGLLGLVLGALGIHLLSLLGADQLPLGATIALDVRVAAVTIASALAVGVALAVPILWHNFHTWLAPVLQTETRGGTVRRGAQRMRHGFIVVQVVLAFVLLSGCGLLGLSLKRILATAPGFHPDPVLTGQLILPEKKYPLADYAHRIAFVERLLSELRAQPGISAVGVTTGLPMTGSAINNATHVEGIASAPGDSHRTHIVSAASSDYFQALGIPLRQGRLLEDADNHREQKVCIVDEAFARHYWPGQSALGRRLVQGAPVFNEEAAHTIVGVVGNIKQNDLADSSAPGTIYLPFRSFPVNRLFIVARTPLAPAALAPLLKKVVLQLDPELAVDQLNPMQAWIDESLVSRRSPALLAGVFAALALSLAAIGTYGVLAYVVGERRQEISVRTALGAAPRQILTQFLTLGMKLLLAGLLLGTLGAWGAGQAMQSVLFGVGTFQLSILLATAVVITVVVLLATFLPSNRASRIDPLSALRAQ